MFIAEKPTLPKVCKRCKHIDCTTCEHFEERYFVYELDKMKIRRKMLQKSLERTQRLIDELDKEIDEYEKQAAEETQAALERFKERMRRLGYDM